MALRMQATLAAHVWSSYSALASSGTISAALPRAARGASVGQTASDLSPTMENEATKVNCLTVELTGANLSIHPLRSGLLLCLAGPVTTPAEPACDSSSSSLVSEAGHLGHLQNGVGPSTRTDAALPPAQPASSPQPPSVNGQSQVGGTTATAEHLRIRAGALAAWLDKELVAFSMPTST